jgi:hypothetical protein
VTDLVVAIAAAGAAALTLFTGFGLATLLTPVLVLFLPVELAISAVAVVHLANNLVKLGLVGRSADRAIALRFGVPAALASIVGAVMLAALVDLPVLFAYDLGGPREITPLKLVVGLVIIAVALAELRPTGGPPAPSPAEPAASADRGRRRRLVAGGLASGLIGGLTGNQGPIRAAVLLRAGMDARAYVATSVVCALFVDAARIGVYGLTVADPVALSADAAVSRPVTVAVIAAATGSIAASRLLRRATIEGVRRLAGGLMLVVGAGLASGLV